MLDQYAGLKNSPVPKCEEDFWLLIAALVHKAGGTVEISREDFEKAPRDVILIETPTGWVMEERG